MDTRATPIWKKNGQRGFRKKSSPCFYVQVSPAPSTSPDRVRDHQKLFQLGFLPQPPHIYHIHCISALGERLCIEPSPPGSARVCAGLRRLCAESPEPPLKYISSTGRGTHGPTCYRNWSMRDVITRCNYNLQNWITCNRTSILRGLLVRL